MTNSNSASAPATLPGGQLGIGIQLPIQAQSPVFCDDWEADATVDDLVAIAQAADRAGLHYIGACDHVAIPHAAAEAMSDVWYDPVATLGLLGGVTERVRLLTHVYVLGYRHPLQAAKSFATLDHLSGGRLVVGVGAGHVEGEFAALGADFAGRGKVLDEAIAALDAGLRDEFPEFDGETWQFGGLGVAPRPVQQPRPPIWVGGSSKPAMRRAARLGDGWLPQGTSRKKLPDQVAFIRSERAAAGRDDPIELGAFAEPVRVGKPDFEIPKWALSGSGERIAASLREFGELGASHVQVKFLARSAADLCGQLAAFGDEVIPLLTK